MIEQNIIIHLTDEDSNEIGILSVSSLSYGESNKSNINIFNSITLENISLVDEPDNLNIITKIKKAPANLYLCL